MAPTLRICVPDATINYVKNPSLRYDTTGYVAFGSTISRVLTQARFGIAALKIVTNGSTLYEGANYRMSWMAGIQGPMTFSVYLRGSGTVRIRLTDNLSGKEWATQPIALTNSRWTRYEILGYASGGNDVHLYVESAYRVQSITFYADAFQVEPHEYPTTYCDGSQENCQWSGMDNASLSTRTAYNRSGGRWITLMGKERDFQDLYMTVAGGLGVAPVTNNIQDYADSPGSYFQRQKINSRVVTFTFHAISKDLLGRRPVSLDRLHSLRQTLYNLIKNDKTAGSQEFLIEYQDGDIPLYLRLRYDGGLEGEWDVRNKWVNSFPVRFIAVSPIFTDDNQEVATLSIKNTATVNYVAQRINGAWSEMNGGLSDYVRQFAIGRRGEIVAVGNFTRANNKISSIDPMTWPNYAAYWDGTQWQSLGVGANGIIYSVAVAPNGDIYVAGNFTSIGGVACNYIAKWNGSVWAALGTGLGSTGYAVKVSSNGDVYAGGAFTTAGGVTARYVARYDGSSWHNCGAELGLNAAVYTIDISPDGSLVYLGGNFTDEYSSPGTLNLDYVALYVPLTNQFEELGDGFDASVLKLVLAPSGRLYACGNFTASGTQITLYVAYWNGMQWYGMGAGANNVVNGIDVAEDGTVLAVGNFTRIGGADANYAAYWNGTAWTALDANVSGNGAAVIRDRYGNIFISFNGTLLEYGALTVVNNPGTSEVSPKFYVSGPGTLIWIENQTSRKRLYLNLEILNGEEIFIDCSKGSAKSSVRGDVSYGVFPGSDLRSWKLQPENNLIECLILNDVQASAQISFETRHMSGDATEPAESA